MGMWKYKIGTVVREKDGSMFGLYTGKDAIPMFGHVIGFDRVEYTDFYETILMIRWEDGSERSIHPDNILVEEDVK